MLEFDPRYVPCSLSGVPSEVSDTWVPRHVNAPAHRRLINKEVCSSGADGDQVMELDNQCLLAPAK